MMTAFLFTLRAIAGTCPLAGGDAVFEARAMLYLVEQIEYNDKAICDAVNMVYALTAPQASTALGFEVSPNPSQGNFSVSVPSDVQLKRVEIIDTKGQMLQSQTFSGKLCRTEIDTDLPSGLYFVRIVTDSGTPYLEKLVITRE